MIKASVLMTVFNAEKYLEHSINSLLKQSYKKFELIIIDDKSNDNSKRIIQNFKNKKIKKYFLPKHIGRTPALNFGLKKCSGKYIAILDADDLSTKDRLLKQINFLELELTYLDTNVMKKSINIMLALVPLILITIIFKS